MGIMEAAKSIRCSISSVVAEYYIIDKEEVISDAMVLLHCGEDLHFV